MAGFVTRPALMQDVHTLIRRTRPSTTALTRWVFGFHIRGLRPFTRRLMASFPSWLTLWPKEGDFPQMSQIDLIRCLPSLVDYAISTRSIDECSEHRPGLLEAAKG
jgi:hypothetical protein